MNKERLIYKHKKQKTFSKTNKTHIRLHLQYTCHTPVPTHAPTTHLHLHMNLSYTCAYTYTYHTPAPTHTPAIHLRLHVHVSLALHLHLSETSLGTGSTGTWLDRCLVLQGIPFRTAQLNSNGNSDSNRNSNSNG